MDYFEKLVKQIRLMALSLLILTCTIVAAVAWLGLQLMPQWPPVLIFVIAIMVGVGASLFFAKMIATAATEPVMYLWKAILHVAPGQREATPPDLEKIRVGKELVTSLALQVYQLASVSPTSHVSAKAHATQAQSKQTQSSVLINFPLPVFVMNKEQTITFANAAALAYIGKQEAEVKGSSMYSLLDLSFSEEETFDAWLSACRTDKVTATRMWEHVRLSAGEAAKKQCDIAAYYNKNNPDGVETVIALFDKTKSYGTSDDAISFIALAVHELRTPLTMLRGYIEVFEEELEGKLTPELNDFMQKMHASAQQLTTFVSNILNVARVDENQLYLQLHEDDWGKTLKSIIEDMALRAQVRGKTLEYNIPPNLPAAAIDKVSMYEVVSNLIDNAIKYSGDSQRIVVRTYLRDDGLIETTVQDFGIGIDTSIIGNLFEKFYRNHRSRAQVGGTGLGLYLSKAIVKAHGGEIWVQSKEGRGSVFGFTIQQYSQLADAQKTADNHDIRRIAHGWIKNHSFYRR